MRIITFILTFLFYANISQIRMGFVMSKIQFKNHYQIEQSFLGLYDFLHNMGMGLGTFFRYYLFNDFEYPRFLFRAGIMASIFFSLVLFVNVGQYLQFSANSLSIYVKISLLISNFGSGLFIAASWVYGFIFMSQYFRSQKDGKWISLHTSAWELGNIAGLFFCNFTIHHLNLNWTVPIFVSLIFQLFLSFAIYYCLETPQTLLNIPQCSLQQFLQFCLSKLRNKSIVYLAIICMLNGSLFVTLVLWLPIYFAHIGYESISGYFTLLLDVFAIVGAFFLGANYQDLVMDENVDEESLITKVKVFMKHNLPYVTNICCVLVLIAWILGPVNIYCYCVYIVLLGFFFGGLFNCLHSNELYAYAQCPKSLEMVSSMLHPLICLALSLSTLMIGYVIQPQKSSTRGISMDDKGQSQKVPGSYNRLLYVLLVFQVLILVFFHLKIQLDRKQVAQLSVHNHLEVLEEEKNIKETK